MHDERDRRIGGIYNAHRVVTVSQKLGAPWPLNLRLGMATARHDDDPMTRRVPVEAEPIKLPDHEARVRIRRLAGLDLREAGARVGVTGAAVSNWERGTREPTGELRAAYAAALARMGDLPGAGTGGAAAPRSRCGSKRRPTTAPNVTFGLSALVDSRPAFPSSATRASPCRCVTAARRKATRE